MPVPSKNPGEDRQKFLSRCMSDDTMKREYEGDKRMAICLSKAIEDADYVEAADFSMNVKEYGFTEEINENNFVVPADEDYVDFGEETEEWDWASDRPGLWENIRKKKEREGKNYKPAKTVKEGRPTQDQLKRAQSEVESYLDHAEADEPGPKDPRRTPAPKKDQKKGSKKNKPDSAKNPSGKITFSKEVIAQLSKKVKEHNDKGKGSKATLGMLKAVYRRGAGAFSTSHAPKMSRHGWSIARVNAFLHLLRTGRPSNPKYTTDNDLLPKGHPKKKSSAGFKYRNPKTGQVFEYDRKGVYTKNGTTLVPVNAVVVNNQKVNERFEYVDAETGITYIFDKRGDHKSESGNPLEYVGIWGDFSYSEVLDYESETTKSAEYQGRKVQLGKPFRTPKGPKKFSVYVKNPKGNVVKVNFGDPNMKIKKSDPARRKSFRARHNCANPGPRHKARYWSCRKW